MCMEDIRIGRKSHGNVYFGTATNASPVEACPANPHRTSFYLAPPGIASGSSASMTYSPVLNPQVGQGVVVDCFSAGIVLTIENMGEIITKSWYAIGNSAAPLSWCVIEKSTGDE